jgi:hypothetical protein
VFSASADCSVMIFSTSTKKLTVLFLVKKPNPAVEIRIPWSPPETSKLVVCFSLSTSPGPLRIIVASRHSFCCPLRNCWEERYYTRQRYLPLERCCRGTSTMVHVLSSTSTSHIWEASAASAMDILQQNAFLVLPGFDCVL